MDFDGFWDANKHLPVDVGQYLKDHPRTCKWLGSLPSISHGVSSAIWKGSHNGIGDLHDHHGYSNLRIHHGYRSMNSLP